MRNAKKILKSTDSSAEYNAALKELYSKCPICPWHRGCYRDYYIIVPWKKRRKKQYY